MSDQMSQRNECPSCGSRTISFQELDHPFNYGVGDDRVVLQARYPIGFCDKCGFEFADARAEVARQEAVCRHLGLLSPKDVASIRKRLGLARAEFAELTKIGEASLSRWERGAGTQNAALDQLLFLLTFEDNVQRLRVRKAKDGVKTLEGHALRTEVYQFPHLGGHLKQKEHEAETFQLRPTGT